MKIIYYGLSVITFFLVLVEAFKAAKRESEVLRKKSMNYLYSGVVVMVLYIGYAMIASDISPVDILFLDSRPEDVKNFWGAKNAPYVPPFGYALILASFVLRLIYHFKTKR